MVLPSPSPLRLIIIPMIISMIAIILGIVVLTTPGLMEFTFVKGYQYTQTQIGPYRVCFTNTYKTECSYMDTSCQITLNWSREPKATPFLNNSSSCLQLKWLRYLFMTALITGVISMMIAISTYTRFILRPLSLFPAIITFSLLSGITSIIAMSLAIVIFYNEVDAVTEDTYARVHFTYGFHLIVIFTLFQSCVTSAYHRIRRWALVDDSLTQPLVTNTTSTVSAPYTGSETQPTSINGRTTTTTRTTHFFGGPQQP